MVWIALLALLGIHRYRQPAESPEEALARLECRISLAREGALHLERSAEGLDLYASGWKLKHFSAPNQQRLGGQPVSLTSVEKIIPVEAPPRKFVLAQLAPSDFVPEGTVASATEVIGVESMPNSFCVVLKNGGIWYVSSGDWYRPIRWLKVQWLHARLGWVLIRAAFGEDPLDCWYVRIEEDSARELFWLLQEEMKVIN